MVARSKSAPERRRAKVNTRPRFSPYRGVDKDAKILVEGTLCTLGTPMLCTRTSISERGDVLDADTCVSSDLFVLTYTRTEHLACDLPHRYCDTHNLAQEKSLVICGPILHGSGASL